MRIHLSGTLAIAVALAALPLSATAQYRPETLTLKGKQVRFNVHKKLAASPLQLGQTGPQVVARFEPTDDGDFIHGKYGKYPWGLYVFAFEKEAKKPATPTTGDASAPVSKEEAERLAREAQYESAKARDFEEFVQDKDPSKTGSRRFIVKGEHRKGSSKRPDSAWWEYSDIQNFTYGGQADSMPIYRTACVYDLGDVELALICVIPLKRGEKPDNKYAGIARRMLMNLDVEVLEADDGELDEKRDQYADTPERQEALAVLKKNIGDLKNWDYFTSPNYLFTFSWEPGDAGSRRELLKFTRDLEVRLEEIRSKFVEFYPPHDKMLGHYSIIRVCHDLTEFQKYGNTPMGVVGWFSPGSKELVVYFDKQRVFMNSEDEMLAVCYHEAWHQYADQYFPGVELHRWFDEGLAEYFGSLRLKGRNWSHVYHRGRLTSLNSQENEGKLIPSAEIVSWDRQKFYGPRAPDHYAQAWAMIDFLIRGKERLGSRWNDRWSEILPIYAKVCLEEKSAKKAVEAAFAGVDFAEYEEAWIKWFDSGDIKSR